MNWYMKKHLQTKHNIFFWFQVGDIKISDISYKIQKFLRTSWAPIITINGINFLMAWPLQNMKKRSYICFLVALELITDYEYCVRCCQQYVTPSEFSMCDILCAMCDIEDKVVYQHFLVILASSAMADKQK